MPLLSFDFSSPTRRDLSHTLDDDSDEPPKKWIHYLPLCGKDPLASQAPSIQWFSTRFTLIGLVTLMVAPHPSWLLILVNHYLRTLHSTSSFLFHLFVSYTLTSLAFCSLIVCVARDPGPISLLKEVSEEESASTGRDDLGLREALMATPDFDEFTPQKWCHACWGPKPERAHHCSVCRRCVLKLGRLRMSCFCYHEYSSVRPSLPMAWKQMCGRSKSKSDEITLTSLPLGS